MEKQFLVSVSPHLHEGTTVKSVMWNVVIAMIPALVASVYFFGIDALLLTIYGVLSAVITEALVLYLRKKPITINDGSAVITGMLVSFNVHTGVPWWLPVVGSAFAILIGKHVFGGLGQNIVNPALLGRAFLVVSWPSIMTGNWLKTNLQSINGMVVSDAMLVPEQITSATPLRAMEILKDPTFVESLGEGGQFIADGLMQNLTSLPTLTNMFWGNIGGCIGEVSAIAILLGAIYLFGKKIIEWRIPFFYLLTVFVMALLLGGKNILLPTAYNLPLFHLLSGGLLLGAFFMATDPVTSPVSKKGRIFFGIGCGIITVVIRLYGNYPEGVSFAILIMNLFVPLIDKFTFAKAFGKPR